MMNRLLVILLLALSLGACRDRETGMTDRGNTRGVEKEGVYEEKAGKQTESVVPEKLYASATEHTMVMPDDLEWGDAPNSIPPGAKMAKLDGDPSKPEPFTIRFKLPANYKIMPHWHPADERLTVLSGSFHMGQGDNFDEKSGMQMTTGGFMVMPAKTHHFAWTTRETVIQLHGIGPWQINYVDEQNDPRKRSGS